MNGPCSQRVILIGLCLVLTRAVRAQEAEAPAVIVPPEALPDLIARHGDRLVLLDCRSRQEYQAGQIAGARWLDAAAWKQESLAAGTLEHPERWRDRMAALNVPPAGRIIVYDDGGMTEAARAWFLLQFVGFQEVAVLDGGFPEARSLLDSGRLPLTHLQTPATQQKSQTASFATATAPTCRVNRAQKGDVLRASGHRDTLILDVRTEAEYLGLDSEKTVRHGHIPDAVNLPHARLLQTRSVPATQPAFKPRGRLKPPEELRQLFTGAGISPDQRIITHCQSGGRAALAALALIRAGYGKVDNYYNSFAEWAADPDTPIVTSRSTGIQPQP